MKEFIETYKNIVRILFIQIWLVSLISCESEPRQTANESTSFNNSLLPPKIIDAKTATVNKLTEFKSPSKTLLSDAPTPVSTKSGYYVSMQNFNTQDGLMMSSIICAYKDRNGNLWFGTSGNGLSKYNGMSFTNFSSNHGLIHNFINAIYQDSKGNMWFGTYGGLSRYDGVSFVNYTVEDGLIDNDVISIGEDPNGNIWLGTIKGICRSSKTLESIGNERFVFEKLPDSPQSAINEIWQDANDGLWFAGELGIWQYKNEDGASHTFKDYSTILGLEQKSVDAVCTDKSGEVWLGINNELIHFSTSNQNATDITVQKLSLTEELADEKILCLTADTKGNIWVGTKNGVAKYNPISETFLNFTVSQGLSNNWINSITEDNSGSIWFGTLGGGVDRYKGEAILEYTGNQGLPGNAVYAIESDADGNMWFAPSSAGVVKYNQNTSAGYSGAFTNYTTAQGLTNNTMLASAKDQQGNMYFGGDQGLNKFNGKEIIRYTTEQGLPDKYITDLYVDKKGSLWIGTFEGGLSIFDGESFTNLSVDQGLVHKTVWNIFEDKDGVIWVATRGGLSQYDGKRFFNFTKEQGLSDNKLSSVIQDRHGNIIIGSWGGGVSVITKEKVKGLKDSNTNNLQPIFENYSSSEGLSNDVVYQILEDAEGQIIVGTNEGFTIFKNGILNENKEIDKLKATNFNERTGYPIKDISNNHSMELGEPGVVWAGTGDKLVRFNYGSINTHESPLHMGLKKININNEQISWRRLNHNRKTETTKTGSAQVKPDYITSELITFNKIMNAEDVEAMSQKYSDVQFDSITPFYNLPVNLKLPYSKNSLTFEYFGIETARPQLVKYQFMLQGYDEDWNPVTNSRIATFGNIAEGNYTFLVKSQSPDGVWSDPLSYSFEVLPPWYRSFFAYTIYVLLFLAMLFTIDKFQRKRLLFLERQKTIQMQLEHAKEIEKAFTGLKATQLQLIHSEKMASLGELSAGVAHEIQNPLNFVNNFSEVSNELIEEMIAELNKGDIEEAKAISIDIKNNLEKITRHGKRADGIVKGMLAHSRSSSGEKYPTDINALADEFLQLSYHGLRGKDKSFNAIPITIGIKTDFDPDLPKINVVPQDIGRVLLNLINNAFQACAERIAQSEAEVSRSAVNEKQKTEGVDYSPEVIVPTKLISPQSGGSRGAYITISDNGSGIPEAIKDKIFQPFFTTKPTGQGTGLGLSLSYDIVKAHGGDLKVESQEGKGTEFKIKMPVS